MFECHRVVVIGANSSPGRFSRGRAYPPETDRSLAGSFQGSRSRGNRNACQETITHHRARYSPYSSFMVVSVLRPDVELESPGRGSGELEIHRPAKASASLSGVSAFVTSIPARISGAIMLRSTLRSSRSVAGILSPAMVIAL